MSDNFEKISENLADPSRVRNFLKDLQNDAERKQYSLFFHVAYALVCSLAVYLAADSSAIPFFAGTGILFLFLAPAMCVFTFLYSPTILKAFPVALPLLFILIRTAFSAGAANFFSTASVLFVYILCIVSGAAITKAVLSGYSKTSLVAILSVIFGTVCFCQVMFSFIANVGTFSFSLLLDTINKLFDSVVENSVAMSQTPEWLETFRSMAVSGANLTDAQIAELVRETAETSVKVVKPLLPAFFVLSCMIFAFITIAVFSLFAKHFKINVFVCIMDKSWTYRPSAVSAAVYDIVFFVFILSMFIPFPENISVTVMNLMLVLTPLMFISGLHGIYSMLFRRNKNRTRSVIITAVIFIIASVITGALAFLIIGSVGVSFITMRNREERLVVPVKYASDLAYLHKLSEEAENEKTQSENDNDNNDSKNQ